MIEYIYKTKPSNVAVARVRFKDGREETVRVAIYQYAYKPLGYWGSETENRKMHVSSGAMACEGAWKRSGHPVPALGVTSYQGRLKLGKDGFVFTAGEPTVSDYWNIVGEVIEFERLPKGFKVWPELQETTYLVKDGHTLGFIFSAQPNIFCPLARSVVLGGHDPNGGCVALGQNENVVLATQADFDRFRVHPPKGLFQK
jgi:hypothetical protein